MFYDEHNPPHFHAEFEAEISINDLSVIKGELPSRVLGLVIEWASLHRMELSNNWNKLINKSSLDKIEPLI